MALAVVDHRITGRKNAVRVAFNTDKLAKAVDVPRECTPECAGPQGCIVHRGLQRAKQCVQDFALTWDRNRAVEHPEWVVYVYEVTHDDKKAAAKGRRKAQGPRRAPGRPRRPTRRAR